MRWSPKLSDTNTGIIITCCDKNEKNNYNAYQSSPCSSRVVSSLSAHAEIRTVSYDSFSILASSRLYLQMTKNNTKAHFNTTYCTVVQTHKIPERTFCRTDDLL